MKYSKITVVTPNYNQARFLEHTIQSVLSQNYPNLEYIIIDGGSTDGSVDIIKKYTDKLHFWVSEKDSGMYEAIQKGFSKSTGEIMTYINSDDILHPYSLCTANIILSQYDYIHWINGFDNQIDENNRIVTVRDTIPNWTKYHYLTGQYQYIQQEGAFWTRDLWNRAGGYMQSNLSCAGDLELWSRFFCIEKLYYLPLILGSFRLRSAGQKSMEQLDIYEREALTVLSNMSPADNFEKKIIKMYFSTTWKILRKFNKRRIYKLFGYLELYNIFIVHQSKFFFDRASQQFKLVQNNH